MTKKHRRQWANGWRIEGARKGENIPQTDWQRTHKRAMDAYEAREERRRAADDPLWQPRQ